MSHPITQTLDRDALNMAPRGQAAEAALLALNPIQQLKPHEMVAGVAVLFAAICERVQLDPEETHALGRKVLRDQEFHAKANMALQSLKDFAGIRIAGDSGTVIA